MANPRSSISSPATAGKPRQGKTGEGPGIPRTDSQKPVTRNQASIEHCKGPGPGQTARGPRDGPVTPTDPPRKAHSPIDLPGFLPEFLSFLPSRDVLDCLSVACPRIPANLLEPSALRLADSPSIGFSQTGNPDSCHESHDALMTGRTHLAGRPLRSVCLSPALASPVNAASLVVCCTATV